MARENELPEVRPASCGHGFLPIDVPPAARVQNGMHEQPVYLCEDCRGRLNTRKVETKPAPPIQTKEIRPGVPLEASPEELRSGPDPAADEYQVMTGAPDAAAEGRRARLANQPRRVPAGIHPRSDWARKFLAAYDEAVPAAE